MDLLIDLRCFQHPLFASRGIGRHSMALLRGVPRDRWHIVGLVDPAMPPLIGSIRPFLHQIREASYTGAMTRPTGLVCLSPMPHDPLFTARLLDHPAIPTAAVVYDFIPYDLPQRYFTTTRARLEYLTALRWLRRYDLFLPISQSAADRLRAILGVPAERITVTGAPVDPAFAALDRATARRAHFLLVGGEDPRKNALCAAGAHGAARAVQRAGIPLVVTGSGAADTQRQLRQAAAEAGGDPDLLRFAGHVDEPTLLELFRDALALLAPSLDEGFSMPVAEAMAAGVPALVSDIPAHRELVPDAARRFAPDDHAMLAAQMDRLAADPAAAAPIIAAQDAIWPRFRAEAVAERFWTAVAARFAATPPAPAVITGARPRLALLSPVPPSPTGIADYTAATCVALGRRVALSVFTPTPAPTALPGTVAVAPITALPHIAARFDRVIGVIGNHRLFHGPIVEGLLRHGGACIAHDSRMIDCLLGMLGPRATADLAAEELGRAVDPAEITGWIAEPATLPATLLGPFTRRAEPLFVHARATVAVIRERYGIEAVHLPFCLRRTWREAELAPERRRAARARLGIPPETVAIASFGFLSASKAPEIAVAALAALRARGVPARLHFVGAPDIDPSPLRAVADRLGVPGEVTFEAGFVSPASYDDWLLAADLGLQLRRVGFGAVSAALADSIAAGLPTVANRSLAEAIDAPPYVARVADALDPEEIAAALAGLLAAGRHRERPREERRAYAAEHDFEVYAARLLAALGLG